MVGIEFHLSISFWFMIKKNIATHDAVLDKKRQTQGCRWLSECWVKNKIATHVPGRYYVPIRYMDGSEPLEWSIVIGNCHLNNFFMVSAHFFVRWIKYQYFQLCEAQANDTVNHSCSKYYKLNFTFTFLFVHDEKEYCHTYYDVLDKNKTKTRL